MNHKYLLYKSLLYHYFFSLFSMYVYLLPFIPIIFLLPVLDTKNSKNNAQFNLQTNNKFEKMLNCIHILSCGYSRRLSVFCGFRASLKMLGFPPKRQTWHWQIDKCSPKPSDVKYKTMYGGIFICHKAVFYRQLKITFFIITNWQLGNKV